MLCWINEVSFVSILRVLSFVCHFNGMMIPEKLGGLGTTRTWENRTPYVKPGEITAAGPGGTKIADSSGRKMSHLQMIYLVVHPTNRKWVITCYNPHNPSFLSRHCPHKNPIEITRVGSPTYDSWDEPPSSYWNRVNFHFATSVEKRLGRVQPWGPGWRDLQLHLRNLRCGLAAGHIFGNHDFVSGVLVNDIRSGEILSIAPL